MGRKLLKLQTGDVFSVPLAGGESALGQIVDTIQELGSVGCAFYSNPKCVEEATRRVDSPFAVLLVTPELIEGRLWPVLSRQSAFVPPIDWPWEIHRSRNWVGAKIYGSAIVSEFLAAYFGLAPWDVMADPGYFDALLVPGRTRPDMAYYAKL